MTTADDLVTEAPVTEWDAQAEIAVGLFIRRHLAAQRPPDDAAFAIDLAVWGERLVDAGQAHLAALEGVA